MTSRQYYLLEDPEGCYLCGSGSVTSVSGTASDTALWLLEEDSLESTDATTRLDFRLDKANRTTLDPGSVLEIGSRQYVVRRGPSKLPSDHLAELKAHGFTVLENLLESDAIARVKKGVSERLDRDPEAPSTDGRVGVPHGVAWSPDVARVVTHPVALWLIQSYLETSHIHFGHPPGVTCLRPAKALLGTYPDSGWHSDYPYHPGVLEEGRWQDDAPLAVQFNICVDAFRTDNAATQFLPESHQRRVFPSSEFNEGGTRMGQGVHSSVRQMTAPAGSALLYDARTWHRACEELNVSGEDRVAILNAVTPDWVLPMTDKEQGTLSYLASDSPDALTQRERDDIDRLCNSQTVTPPQGAPTITRRVRP